MNSTIINAFSGWATGYQYSLQKTKEDEVKQGKNYYISAFHQTGQFLQLGSLALRLNSVVRGRSLNFRDQIFAVSLSIVSLVAYLFFASVKQDSYTEGAKKTNNLISKKISWIPIRLPEKLNPRIVSTANFFAEHSGDIMRVAMIVGSVALIVLEGPSFGAGALVAISYEAIYKMGFVPRKISLFMETYMPVVSSLGIIAGGPIMNRIAAIAELSMLVSSSAKRFVHEKIVLFYQRLNSTIPIPSLQEIDAPVVEKRELTFGEISKILDGDGLNYEINPAHCSKWVRGLSEFPSNTNFDQYLTLFDKIDWKTKYGVVQRRLKDDDIFIDSLYKKLPEVEKEVLRKKFDYYVDQVAREAAVSKEEYAAKWLREQFTVLVSVLKGTKPVKGMQSDLADAINSCSKLLAYLESIQNQNSVEFEDILLKLAVEGGNYCARGIKRAAGELTSYILQRGSQEGNHSDPVKDYELKIAGYLQDQRMAIVQQSYQELVRKVHIPEAISHDTHGFDLYRAQLSFGFYPFTEYERSRFDVRKLLGWITLLPKFNMYGDYLRGLDQAITENGEVNFGIYIRQVIFTNPKLSPMQKDALSDKCTEMNDGKWTIEGTQQRFHRLMFVMLGVLREKKGNRNR